MRQFSARRWDFAGPDGLALAQAVFGPSIAHLAAYQSCETEYGGIACSLLRLNEGNFRVGVFGDADGAGLAEALETESATRRVWVKPCRLEVIIVKEAALAAFAQAATVKAPHRLVGLPANHAVPIRLEGRAALIWRHPLGGVPMLEIQITPDDREAVCRTIAKITGQPA